jgi:PAS domain S-box-containing protein
MDLHIPALAFIYFIGLIITIFIALLVFKRRPAPGALPFSLFVSAGAIWSFFWILELSSIHLGDKILWAKLEYLGIASTGMLWLFFVLDYTGRTWWRKPRNLLLLSGLPLISLGVIWTNEWHNLYWSNIYIAQGNLGNIAIWEKGPWFIIFAVYQYSLILLGIVLLWKNHLRKSHHYIKQIGLLTFGVLLPVAINLVYLLKLPWLEGIDLTPVCLAIAAIAYALSIFRYDFMSVSTVARDALVEHMPGGIIVTDLEGRIIDANPGLLKIINTTRKTAIGKPFNEFWPELANLAEKTESNHQHEFIYNTGAAQRHFDFTVTPLFDKGRKSSGKMLVLRDVTLKRQMEKTIIESEKRYATLVEQSNDGILIIVDQKIVFSNLTFAAMSGYSLKELKDMPLANLLPEEEESAISEMGSSVREGKPISRSFELHFKCKDGMVKDGDISISLVTIDSSVATLVTLRDITEKKVTQRKIEVLYSKEKALSQSLKEEIDNRSKYTRAMVHELKTPLTAILSSGEILESEIDNPVLLPVVKNIRKASLNLEYRANELIDLACGEIGILTVETEPMDVGRLIKSVSRETAGVIKDKDLDLKLEIAEIPLIKGDDKRLKAVFANLLDNAVKYTKRGVITIRAKDFDAENLLIQVQDTGCGMENSQIDNLFDPYRRKSTEGQKYGGIGVGLALAKLYIELHKGKIWVESNPGKGTTIFFTLPIYKDNVPENLSQVSRPSI